MSRRTIILVALAAFTGLAVGGPTNPIGWDPTWSIPLAVTLLLAAVAAILRDLTHEGEPAKPGRRS